MPERIVLALGGNALQRPGDETFTEQLQMMKESSQYILNLVTDGCELVLTHGNGPQVGRIMLQNELSLSETPAMPMDVCGAMSQGMIGYGIQRVMREVLKGAGEEREVASLVTQVLVDRDDPAFKDPSKFVGKFYKEHEVEELQQERGYVIKKDSNRGFRRVVPSPEPKAIVELDVVKALLERGVIVITVGGGGIPVVEDGEGFDGVEAVIDKDLASCVLARDLEAHVLMILTDVDHIYVNYGREDERPLGQVEVEEIKRYRDEGEFPKGSMLPKVDAAIRFVESKEGRRAIITSLDRAVDAYRGKTGTIIT